jgi:hypothetical protein
VLDGRKGTESDGEPGYPEGIRDVVQFLSEPPEFFLEGVQPVVHRPGELELSTRLERHG